MKQPSLVVAIHHVDITLLLAQVLRKRRVVPGSGLGSRTSFHVIKPWVALSGLTNVGINTHVYMECGGNGEPIHLIAPT